MTRSALPAVLALLIFAASAARAQETTAAEPAAEPVYFVQLASLNSPAAAEQAWNTFQTAHPALLGDLRLSLQAVDLGDRGVFYRVQTGPLPNRATAKDLCWQIKAAKQDCVVVRR